MPADLALEARDLTVSFGGLVALDAVNVGIPANQVTGVIGPNGAGKTTLFNAICGFVRPASGEITYGGRSLIGVRTSQLTGFGISRTLQSLGLWPGLTVTENVMVGALRKGRPNFVTALLGMPRSDRDEAAVRRESIGILDQLGIEQYRDALPSSLPYGVQKWVAMARALVSRPSLLLLDEPASGLAAGEIEQFATLLQSWRDQMTIVLVEHRLDLVMSACDQVTVLDFGQVIASGTAAAIQSDAAVTAAYLGEDLEPDDA